MLRLWAQRAWIVRSCFKIIRARTWTPRTRSSRWKSQLPRSRSRFDGLRNYILFNDLQRLARTLRKLSTEVATSASSRAGLVHPLAGFDGVRASFELLRGQAEPSGRRFPLVARDLAPSGADVGLMPRTPRTQAERRSFIVARARTDPDRSVKKAAHPQSNVARINEHMGHATCGTRTKQ